MKTYTTLSLYIMGDFGDPVMDNLAFGARMAAYEINSNNDILPDATIRVGNTFPPPSIYPAMVYDYTSVVCTQKKQYAVIGPGTTAIAMPVFLTCPSTPGFSVGAAGDQLSDKTLYPLFFRYATTWSQKLNVQIGFFKYFGWDRIAMPYGGDAVFRTAAKISIQTYPNYGIEVSASVLIPDPPVSTNNYSDVLRPIFTFLQSTDLRIFNVLAGADQVADCLHMANLTGLLGPNYVWTTTQAGIDPSYFSSRWGGLQLSPSLLKSAIVLSEVNGPFANNPNYLNFIPRFKTYLSGVLASPEVQLYGGIDPNAASDSVSYGPLYFYSDFNYTWPSSLVAIGYDGMYAIARAWEKTIASSGLDARALSNGTLQNQVKLADILSNAQINTTLMSPIFGSSGNLVPQTYTLNQYDGTTLFSAPIVALLSSSGNNGLYNFTVNRAKFSWGGNRSFSDTPIAYTPTVEIYVHWESTGTKVMIGMAMVASAYCIILAIIVMIYRKEPYVKSSSPYILLVTALGLAIIPLNVFTEIGAYRPLACQLRTFPTVLGITIVMASVFAKCLRLYVIFCRPMSLSNYITILTKEAALFGIMAAIVATMLAVLIGFSFGASFQSTEVYIDSTNTYVWACVNKSNGTTVGLVIVGILIVALLVAVTILAYYIRAIPDLFNNVRETIHSIYIITVLAIVTLLQGIMSYSLIETEFYSENGTIQLAVIIVGSILLGTPLLRQMTSKALFTIKPFNRSTRSRMSYNNSTKSFIDTKAETSTLGNIIFKGQVEAKTHKLEKKYEEDKTRTSQLIVNKSTATLEEIARLKSNQQSILRNKSAVTQIGRNLKQWRRIRIILFLDPAYAIRCSFHADPNNVFYHGFSNTVSVRSMKETDYGFTNVVELYFEDHMVAIPFEDEFKMNSWTDAICRTVISHEDPKQLKNIGPDEYITDVEIIRQSSSEPPEASNEQSSRKRSSTIKSRHSKKRSFVRQLSVKDSNRSSKHVPSSVDAAPKTESNRASIISSQADSNRF
ncbi:hypothetical protein BDV3_002478 [Batrachochytrium dendrobatidis]